MKAKRPKKPNNPADISYTFGFAAQTIVQELQKLSDLEPDIPNKDVRAKLLASLMKITVALENSTFSHTHLRQRHKDLRQRHSDWLKKYGDLQQEYGAMLQEYIDLLRKLRREG